jgi:pimeloyl-ACP methyl ester carboxylesterase
VIVRFKLFYNSVTFILLGGLLFSCTKEEDSSFSYFVSKEEKLILSASYINNFINEASAIYPEVNSLKQNIINDVIIYKLVYRTTVKGEKVNASALICVPSIPGEYPVISFQNGTNTVDARAPSNYAIDPAYQMIEIIASMGYIVLLADYPGFGESVNIPHPYLVKEPIVQSLVDLLYAAKEIPGDELGGVTLKDEIYLLGYSQGGWATLALHKALELDYSNDFNLVASACGAGPYNIYSLLQAIAMTSVYPMPVYFAYIVNAFSYFNQFSTPVNQIFNDPYAGRLGTLFNGNLSLGQINNQLTTSIPGLLQNEFITGFESDLKYLPVRDALIRNSIMGWKTNKSILLLHGTGDTHVYPSATEDLYTEMINAGSSPQICKLELIPGLDHGEAAVLSMVKGLIFLTGLK